MAPQLPVVDPWPRARVLKEEREVIGFYVSGHPLEAYTPEMRAFTSARIADIESLVGEHEPVEDDRGYASRPVHTVCGIITEVQHRRSKSGKPMAFATIEDFTGQAEVLCFSSTYDRAQRYLEVDEVVLVRGGLDLRGGSPKIIADEITPMWKVRDQMVRSLVLDVDPGALSEETITEIHALCERNRGPVRLYFDLHLPDDRRQRLLSRTMAVEANAELMQGMAKLVGRHHIQVEGERT